MGLNLWPSSHKSDVTKINTNPNPNPYTYRILMSQVVNRHLILHVHYLGCTTYEGRKVLVFDKDITLAQIRRQGYIDPHFCDKPGVIAPIARFVPTGRGFQMAQTFATHYA